jgi:hypothetical protein
VRVDNIKMNLRGMECGGMDWIDMVQDSDQWMAFVNKIMYLDRLCGLVVRVLGYRSGRPG